MTRKTIDAIQTSSVIVLVIAAVLAFWVYPLNQAGKIVERPEETAELIEPSQNGFVSEPFKILTEDNLSIAGFYLDAVTDSASSPAGTFILLHGLFVGMESQLEKASDITSLGYNVIIFDQRGFGQSDGDYRSGGTFEGNDLQSLLSRFELEDKLIQPVVVWGEAHGGTAGIRTAAEDARIDYVIAEEPVVDGRDWQKRVVSYNDMSTPDIMLSMVWWWMKQTSNYEIELDETEIDDQVGMLSESKPDQFFIIASGTGDTPDNSYLAELNNLGGNWVLFPSGEKDLYMENRDSILAFIKNKIMGNTE
ncbi:MAG: alpha/beta hydrolase [candidate division Zixibacteria bacterium]|nr:alpha/beta hydrolase [candidate division Zixibacteria bacterium]